MILALDQKLAEQDPLLNPAELLKPFRDTLFKFFLEAHQPPVTSKALTLKVLNLCLAKHDFLSRNTSIASRPFGLIVDPSNSCNLACPGCVHSDRSRKLNLFDWKPGNLTPARFDTFMRHFGPYAMQSMFYNYGEPVLNPNTPELIRHAKGYLTQTVLSTNLSCSGFDAGAYVKSGLDYMILSIDGATQPIYERYRRRGQIELVYENIRNLVSERALHKEHRPLLNWQFLAFEHNVHEIPAAINKARQMGVDQFSVVRPFQVSWDDPEIHPANVEPMILEFNQEAVKEQYKWNGSDYGLNADAMEEEFEAPWKMPSQVQEQERVGPSNHTCHWLYKNIVMDAHGRIFPCAAAPKNNKRTLVFAQIEELSKEGGSFNSDKYQVARQFFARGEAVCGTTTVEQSEPYCFKCEWNQTKPDIDVDDVQLYLQASGLFSAESVERLCTW